MFLPDPISSPFFLDNDGWRFWRWRRHPLAEGKLTRVAPLLKSRPADTVGRVLGVASAAMGAPRANQCQDSTFN